MKNKSVIEKEHDASDQEKIATDAKHNQTNFVLPHLKKLEERVLTLERKSMLEMQAQGGLGVNMPNEVQLRERKRNNLILFGLNGASQDGGSDQDLMRTLFDDLGVKIDLETSIFRVGRACTDGRRPIIIKLKDQETKSHILFQAKGLKNNEKWKGISIAHDLTKMQCQQAKAMEMQLRKTAHEKMLFSPNLNGPKKSGKLLEAREIDT